MIIVKVTHLTSFQGLDGRITTADWSGFDLAAEGNRLPLHQEGLSEPHADGSPAKMGEDSLTTENGSCGERDR
jgi:hypothetical protein